MSGWAPRPKDLAELADPADAYAGLLRFAEGDDAGREGLADTPARAAQAFADLTSGYGTDPASLFTTFDADGYDELVLMRSIPFYSLCEHHLLPMFGTAAVGYIAAGRIIGLSKLARLVHVYARRLQTQERLTKQIADALEEHLSPAAVIVCVEARHLCMEMRGVSVAGAATTTNEVRGLFRHAHQARAEAVALLVR